MKKIAFCLLLAGLASMPAQAQTVSSHTAKTAAQSDADAAAKKLLETMNYRQVVGRMADSMAAQMPNMIRSVASASINKNDKLTPAQKQAALDKVDKQIPDATRQMVSNLKDPAVVQELMSGTAAIYAKHYTADEIRQITAFYQSPVGVKTLATMPQLMGESMALAQKVMVTRIAKSADNLASTAAK